MELDRWHRIQKLFLAARGLPSGKREKLLDQRCEDPSDRRLIDSMLNADDTELDIVEESIDQLRRDVESSIMRQTLPESIGPYRTIDRLGSGGTGTVYLAEHTDGPIQRRVAIKLLRRELECERLASRFRVEMQALATLEHPNIARLYSVGVTDDDRPFFVMEYVEGTRLTDYCRLEALSVENRVRLFLQVCAAVQYAHSRLILHRDLKPDNILVTDVSDGDPRVKLLDFGLSRELSPEGDAARVTITSEWMLTPQYASPEQVRGETLTTSSDVYSLGIILYELLSGCSPYEVKNTSALAIERAVCRSLPESPSSRAYQRFAETDSKRASFVRKALRGNLDSIILKALEKETDARYASPELLKTDLEGHLSGEPILANSYSWKYPLRKLHRRARPHLKHVASLAIGVLVFTIALLVYGPIDKNPIRADFQGEYLHFKNRSGQTIDRVDLEGADTGQDYLTPLSAAFLDLDGDGINEVFHGFDRNSTGSGTSEIVARRVGVDEPLWRLPLVFDVSYPFKAGTRFKQFAPMSMLATDVDRDGRQELFAVVVSHNSFSSLVLELDPSTGDELQRYVHPGWLRQLAASDIDRDGTNELLLGGMNNAFGKDAVLVVLDPRQIHGHGPHIGDYVILDYEPTDHKAYLRFPPSKLRELLLTQSTMVKLFSNGDEGVTSVQISDGSYSTPALPNALPLKFYVLLDSRLRPLDVNTSNTYDAVSSKLYRDGVLSAQLDRKYWQRWMQRIQYWTGETWRAANEQTADASEPFQ